MSNRNIKIGTNCQRHMEKYEGATKVNYVAFSKITAQKVAISRMDTELTERLNIYTVAHLLNISTEAPEQFIDENDYHNYLIENSKNPYELARLWKKAKADAESWSCKESMIAESLPAFPKKCFERWGDKNWLKDVSKKWFNDKAIKLDVVVEIISENNGIEISINDCIEFVMKYKPDSYKNPKRLEQEIIEKRFKEIVGFSIKDYYADHLIKSNEFYTVSICDQAPF